MGLVGKVVADASGALDWSRIYGARLTLTLNDGQPFDAKAAGVTGFSFHIDSEPPPNAGLRVESFSNLADNDPPWWRGATHPDSPVHLGHNEFRWADIGGPMYLQQAPPFDPTRLVAIAFHVPTDTVSTKSFAFCLRDVTPLFD